MTTHKEGKGMAETRAKPDALRAKPSLSMVGLLIFEIIIGYEWFISGLTKFVRGDFPSGLPDELAGKSADVTGWYAGFFNGVVIPNATIFGYLIETAEVLAGIALIAGPLIWLFAWSRVPNRAQAIVIFIMAAASIGGIFMALNFHLANGNTHAWLIPADSFDEGVDFDSLLAIMNIVTATVNIMFFNRLRQESNDVVAVAFQVKQSKYT